MPALHRGAALAAVVFGAALGCATSPIHDHIEKAEAQISKARRARADHYASENYEQAVSALDRARDAEGAAMSERSVAETARKRAEADVDALAAALVARRADIPEAEGKVPAAEFRLAQLRSRAEGMRRKGLTSTEIDRAIGADLIIAGCDVQCSKAGVATIRSDIALLELELEAAKRRLDSASQQYDMAGQRLLLAKDLAQTAAAEGTSAEARSLAVQKEHYEAALGGVGAQSGGLPPAPEPMAAGER